MRNLWVLLCFVASAYSHSPAILWPADQFHLPDGHSALQTMASEDFKRLFADKKVIIFHRRTLDMEDVAYSAKPLRYLQSVDAIAVQGVKNAQRMLASLTASDSVKVVALKDDQDLSEQDQQIKETMQANSGYVAVLIGSGSGAHHLSRRQANQDPVKSVTKLNNETNCFVYSDNVEMVNLVDGKTSNVSYTVECPEPGNITIKINNRGVLQVYQDRGGYSISASEGFKLDVEVTWAPEAFSYSCSNLRLYSAGNNSEKISYSFVRLQLYPKGNLNAFPESFDCATWLTPSLCMGVSIVIFYLAILFISVLLLLDVKTNDRFDDPKGKTITVNVSE